jgi:hypothetical protein
MAKEAPLGTDGPMNALEMQFFLLPSFLHRVLWFQMRSGGELIWASERDSGTLLAFAFWSGDARFNRRLTGVRPC